MSERLVHRAQCLIDGQPSRYRLFPGFVERSLQQFHLLTAQRLLETQTFFTQFQQAFALVGLGRDAVDQVHFLQLAQRHVQRLLAHAEQLQQFFHAQGRVTSDEKHDALVHPAQASALQHFVGFGGKSLVAEKERFHGFLLGGGFFKVKHIDVSV